MVITRVMETFGRRLRYHDLNVSTIRLIAISGASFVNEENLSSHLSLITIFTDKPGWRIVLAYPS